MHKTIICLIAILFAIGVKAQQRNSPENTIKFPSKSEFANSKLTYKIIDAPGHTYCYDVYSDGRLMIHQNSVPGLPGNQGFKTRANAEKVARLTISKINKGEMPPTISVKEMKELKVIN